VRAAKLTMAAALPGALAIVLTSQSSRLTPTSTVVYAASRDRDDDRDRNLNGDLEATLSAAKFTGQIEQSFQKRIERNLGRPINPRLASLGRLLWFDKLQSLGRDNACGGCHSPTNGMGDSQPIAIGVQNNNVVGSHRTGPRNQRRSPSVVNAALYPNMMWNGRFASVAGDAFDNSLGFRLPAFPVPEDPRSPSSPVRFAPAENALHGVTHLLQAQAHMSPTELIEVAGFKGTCRNGIPDKWLGPRFCQFDDDTGPGQPLPAPDASGFRHEPIRQATLAALNGSDAYRQLFGDVFPETAPPQNRPIDFFMFGKAIAEFEFTLVFADAPLDRFARGNVDAMTASQKRGALLFFGKAKCVECHKVGGDSNEMFSDFEEHVIGVPQNAPMFGTRKGNVIFSGPGEDEDFGGEERTGDRADRYKFRTAPLRNLGVSSAFFHNGAYTRLDDAIRFHLNVVESAKRYNPAAAGLPDDLTRRVGPPVPKLLLDSRMKNPIKLTEEEFRDLVHFVENGLLDQRVKKANLCDLIPASVPSGLQTMVFEGCPRPLGDGGAVRSAGSSSVP
jgi:cytochrome c peroxidase